MASRSYLPPRPAMDASRYDRRSRPNTPAAIERSSGCRVPIPGWDVIERPVGEDRVPELVGHRVTRVTTGERFLIEAVRSSGIVSIVAALKVVPAGRGPGRRVGFEFTGGRPRNRSRRVRSPGSVPGTHHPGAYRLRGTISSKSRRPRTLSRRHRDRARRPAPRRRRDETAGTSPPPSVLRRCRARRSSRTRPRRRTGRIRRRAPRARRS